VDSEEWIESRLKPDCAAAGRMAEVGIESSYRNPLLCVEGLSKGSREKMANCAETEQDAMSKKGRGRK
jgi:hypothetical protein